MALKGQMDVDFSDHSTNSIHVETQSEEMVAEEKRAAVQGEINRMQQLPANSAYAVHRRRVLDKILHLLSVQRSASEDHELELLFAQMSL